MIHTPLGLVAEFTPLFTRLMHFYHDMAFNIKNAITRVQNSWDENNKNVTTLSWAKASEWWQAPWLSDKRASGFNTLLTLLIRRVWCSQLTKLAKHQTSLWYGMWLLWIALITGYIFSFHWCLGGRLTELPPVVICSECILYICLPKNKNKKKNPPLLHTCLTGHCSLTTPNSPSSAIFDYFDFIAAATFCQLPNLTLSHEA